MDMRLSGTIEDLFVPTLDEKPLASLRDEPIAARFHAWLGASGRRYVTSVFPVDRARPLAGLPDFDAFVLVPVILDGSTRRAATVVSVERASDKRFAVASALARDVREWHVHLLAMGRPERARVVADLAGRHDVRTLALSA